ncbi:MAG TPA: hypothetical protein DEF47_20045 [Herpetosiphon sp.]|nr:hypothetical protein [Herpetosiphon sp.]
MEIGSTETAKRTKNAKAGGWGNRINRNNPENELSTETAKSMKNAKARSWGNRINRNNPQHKHLGVQGDENPLRLPP